MTLATFKLRWIVVFTLLFVMTAKVPAELEPAVVKAQAERIAVIQKATACTVAIFGPAGGGGGSGVVISPDGYALTNFHVTDGCGDVMKCGMSDGKLYDAVVVGVDPTGDVALIKMFGRDDFPTAELADSDQVRAGDKAFSVGNPFLLATDFTPSVSYGIVSGVHRYQYPAGTLLEYADCIQTDAAINPGNSGGPLFDAAGRVIGINGRGSFEKRGRVNVGVGYAISINQIKHFMGYLRSGRVVDHATWGTLVASDEDGRVIVSDIQEDSDAYRRGIRYDDEIIKFGGREIRTVNGLKNVLGIFPKGWRVPVTYRHEGDTFQTYVRLRGVHGQGELASLLEAKRLGPPGHKPKGKRPGKEDPKDKGKKKDKPLPEKHPRVLGAKNKKPPMPQVVKDHYQPKSGYVNYHYNELNQRRVWKAFTESGDYSELPELWSITAQVPKQGVAQVDLSPKDGTLQLPTFRVQAALGDELSEVTDPPGSGGMLVALHLWQRLLLRGIDDFGQLDYLGTVPAFVPGQPFNDKTTMLDVLVGIHGGVECRFMFDPKSGRLVSLEMFSTDYADPCELLFKDYQERDGRSFPATIIVRHGERMFVELETTEYRFIKEGGE